MAKISDIQASLVQFAEGAAPGTPAAGVVRIYAKADGKMYAKDDAGNEYDLTAGGGGSVATDVIWDAAGDLAVGTGANTAAKLAVGSTGHHLEVVAGTAAWTNAVACKAYHNTTQTLSTGAFAAVSLAAEDFDTDTMHDTGANTDRITVPVAGLYLAIASVTFAATTAGNQRAVQIRVNGAVTSSTTTNMTADDGGTAGSKIKAQALLSLSANDYVSAYAYQDTGGDLALGHASSRTDQNELMVVKLGVL